ncbi:MAG: hypothetical protein LBN98_04940, partial [Prevotellaceae bacterium]|nr:hypothetical protein [Prevotellaceae bacterium]
MKKIFTLMVAAAMVFAGCKSEAGEDDGNNSGTNPDVPSLSVVPSGIPVPASGGSYDFAIASKTIWSTAITTGAAWCRISPTVGTGDATGQITVDRNTVAEARAATITFTAGALTCTTTVTQAADNPALSVDKTTINAVKAAGSYTIAVTSNTTWTVSDNADWCTVS